MYFLINNNQIFIIIFAAHAPWYYMMTMYFFDLKHSIRYSTFSVLSNIQGNSVIIIFNRFPLNRISHYGMYYVYVDFFERIMYSHHKTVILA